jgi:phosphonate metabolism protein PhnN/1,5-bisphosphokinase (PRPP-forming)
MSGSANGRTGTLVLVVGASGVGKDTLIDAARRAFAGRPDMAFPRRVITRTDQTAEQHVQMSSADFAVLKAAGGFLIDWQAHGFSYGIPIEAEARLRDGAVVVVNGSRAALDDARVRWPRVRVIDVIADPAILRERLRRRGRESAEEIERRVARAQEIVVAQRGDVAVIDNSNALEIAVGRFLALLEAYANESAG